MTEDRPTEAKECFVYLIGNPMSSIVKVGLANHPERRLNCIRTSNNEEMEIRLLIPLKTREAGKLMERSLHEILKSAGRHQRGEWFLVRDWEIDLMSKALARHGVLGILEMPFMDMGKAA